MAVQVGGRVDLAGYQYLRHLFKALRPFVGPWLLFQFLDFYTVGGTFWKGDHPVAKAATYTENNTNT
jgi:hypothetical protein